MQATFLKLFFFLIRSITEPYSKILMYGLTKIYDRRLNTPKYFNLNYMSVFKSHVLQRIIKNNYLKIGKTME